MIYPPDIEPRLIDWRHSQQGGFRFYGKTDEAGEPRLAYVRLDPAGEPESPPQFAAASSLYFTALLVLTAKPAEGLQLWRFTLSLDDYGFFVTARRVGTRRNVYEWRRVSFFADDPATSF